ncbi:SpaA isopeptide-forming pilin-related protein [Streptococcus marmotae]|uniref:SpaA isopeptide-forming pilin-related protein n=1 Tax=Streptococcus marmotae TaxID=1825069 RepID=UPI00082DA4DB|nr:SpaA isopeptide-forming pilin-related protein [Streptococcus marmotae]
MTANPNTPATVPVPPRKPTEYYLKDGYGRFRRYNEANIGYELANVFKKYEWIDMERKVDDALILQELYIYEPVRMMDINQPSYQLDYLPDKTEIRMTVTDLDGNLIRYATVPVDWTKLQGKEILNSFTAPDYDQGGVVVLNRDDLGLNPGERVSKYNVVFQNHDAQRKLPQEFWTNVVDKYTIKPGTNKTVKNESSATFSAGQNRVYLGPNERQGVVGHFTRQALGGTGDTNSTFGARTANVYSTSKPNPIIDVAIGLQKADGNVVTAGVPQADGSISAKGKNRLSLSLTNRGPSLVAATGPISMTASLPPGVTLDRGNPDWKVTLYQKGGKEKKVINVDGKYGHLATGTNAQGGETLIFTWNDPNAKLQVGDRIELEINANVTNTVDPNFTLEGYGNVGNKDFTVPTGALDPIIDTNNIDGDDKRDEKLAVARANYKLANSRDLQIKKTVKGELDKEYSAFGHTPVGGMIDYRLDITNTTGDVIRRMGFMDVLPNLNDTAVTNTTQRGSKFRPSLTGPITVPAEWQDKVTVYYTTVAVPSREDLYSKVDYPEGASQPDAVNAEDPNWQTADMIADWSAVTAFKVELNEGVAWIQGQNIHMDFKMKAPDNPDATVIDTTIDEKERAAWNSFSVTTNGLFAVEPEKVGVVLVPNDRYQLKIIKRESDTNTTLSGAHFQLLDEAKKAIDKQEGVTDNQGELVLKDLPQGTYYIREKKAPNGYVRLADDIKLVIGSNGQVTLEDKDKEIVRLETSTEDKQIVLSVKNAKNEFPHTGGIGTAIFVAVGLSLMLGSSLRLKQKTSTARRRRV